MIIMEDHEKQLDQLCRSYGDYFKVDMSPDVKKIEEAVEETLTRLEEFETILLMMRSSAESQLSTAILDKKEELMRSCQKVRFLEELVVIMKQMVDSMENKVTAAETQLKSTNHPSPLHNILRPILFMRPESTGVGPSSRRDLTYTPQPVLDVQQFFLTDQPPTDDQTTTPS